ncbi:MAG: hypothetical protein J07HX64_01293 [halophilic archaeon J07HX64]|jgi:hypothetical protein|nr:MAG: hypothetical protein J07HX64_01293 [halophilic archaeon J07HX64]
MTTATRFRDSTQIVLPGDALVGLRSAIDERFIVTVRQEDNLIRIIGSPSEIKQVGQFLSRNGILVA